jgi:hypothetical protein
VPSRFMFWVSHVRAGPTMSPFRFFLSLLFHHGAQVVTTASTLDVTTAPKAPAMAHVGQRPLPVSQSPRFIHLVFFLVKTREFFFFLFLSQKTF